MEMVGYTGSKDVKKGDAALFSTITHEPRGNFYFVFYSKRLGKTWILSSEEFLKGVRDEQSRKKHWEKKHFVEWEEDKCGRGKGAFELTFFGNCVKFLRKHLSCPDRLWYNINTFPYLTEPLFLCEVDSSLEGGFFVPMP